MREKSAGFLRSDRANNPRSSRQKKTADEEEGEGEEGRENRVRSRNRTGGGCFTAIFLEERYKRELFAVYVERSSSSSSFGFPFGREPKWKSVVLQKPWKSRAISWRRMASKNGEPPPCARIDASLFGREFFGAAGWLLCGAARIPTRFPLLLYGESVVDVGIGCGYDMCKSM